MKVQFKSELQFLLHTAQKCANVASGIDGIKQISPVFCTIPFNKRYLQKLLDFELSLESELPDLVEFGRNRAKKAYHSFADTITKPSYSGRIRNSNNLWRACQLDTIEQLHELEPNGGGMVFSVFHPNDLHDRRRPGYIPCLVSGSFNIVNNKLDLNAFFRSQSILEFGLYDLIFLRSLQSEMVERLAKGSEMECGYLNLNFSRIIIQRRLARRRRKHSSGVEKHVSLKRDDVVNTWILIAQEII